MENAEQTLLKVIDWLLGLTSHSISPDAYATILKAVNQGVLHIFGRAPEPHPAELIDLQTAVGIVSSRRRPEARYGLLFLREAVAFREEEYSQPIQVSGALPTQESLINALYEASKPYSSRYMPPERGSFDDYTAYYSNLTFRELLSDANSLPKTVALNRAAALFLRLIDLSCDDQAVSPDDRFRAAELSGVIEDAIRTTQSKETIERFQQAAAASFDRLVTYSHYSELAARIQAGEFSKTRAD